MKYTIEQLTAAGYRVMDLYESIEMNPPGSGFTWEQDHPNVGCMLQVTDPCPTEAACWEEADIHHEIHDGLAAERILSLWDSEVAIHLGRGTGLWSWDWSGAFEPETCAGKFPTREALLSHIDAVFASFAAESAP